MALRYSILVITSYLFLGSCLFAQEKNVSHFSAKSSSQNFLSTPSWIVTVSHKINLAEAFKLYNNYGIVMNSATSLSISNKQVLNITTGTVIDDAGHVLVWLVNLNPNNSLDSLTVYTTDQRELPAKLVGLDGITGLAILQVPGLIISPPKINSDISVFKLEDEVTVWIPAFERNKKTILGLDIPKIQIHKARVLQVSSTNIALKCDAPTLNEHSLESGVVVNQENKVLGLTRSEENNIFRVLPIVAAKQALDRVLKSKKSVPRGWLGVGGKDIASMPEKEKSTLNLIPKQGVLVDTVLPQSPAEKAGIKVNDIIIEIDGHPLKSLKEFLELIFQQPAGAQFELTLIRNEKNIKIIVILGERGYIGIPLVKEDPVVESLKIQLKVLQVLKEELQKQLQQASKEDKEHLQSEYTKTEEILTVAQTRYKELVNRNVPAKVMNEKTTLGIITTNTIGGVVISSVEPNGLADKLGIQPGDILREWRGRKIYNRSQLFRMIMSEPFDSGIIQVIRKKKILTFRLHSIK